MNGTTVLMMSYYREDTRTLLSVAAELRRTTDLRPLFFIACTGRLYDDAAAVVRAAGFDLFEELPHEDMTAGRDMRNPFRRAGIVRRANLELATQILERTGAAAIVCTADAARGRFVEAAQALGIPSLYVQWAEMDSIELSRAWWRAEARWSDLPHRPLMRLRRRLRRKINEAAGFGHRWPFFIPATRLAVAGPFYAEMCIRAGIPAERIAVTGNAQCDAMHRCANLRADGISDIKRSLGLADSTKILLYALNDTKRLVHLDQSSAAEAERTILAAMRAANPESIRVVKLHPKQGEEDRARIREIDKDAVVVGEGTEVGELVAAASAVVSTVSSVLLWAVGIDRPAISAYLWRGAEEMRSVRWWSGVEHADSFDALVKSLNDNLQDPAHIATWRARRRECRDRFLRLDGRSVSRIVESLCSLLPVPGGTEPRDRLAAAPNRRFGASPENRA
jgi:hypothetical protein